MPTRLRTDRKPRRSASFPCTASSLWKILGGKKRSAGLINVTVDLKTRQSPKCLHRPCFSFPSPPTGPKHLGENDQAKATCIFRKALLPSCRTLVWNHLPPPALLCHCTPNTLLALSLRDIPFTQGFILRKMQKIKFVIQDEQFLLIS